MSIKIVDLTVENLEEVPEVEYIPYSCKYCLYWESPEEHAKLPFNAKKERFYRKLEWLNVVSKSFGNCGKLAYLNNKMVGYAEYAPSNFLPNSKAYSSGLPDEDAILIACLYIFRKEARGAGLGQILLESIISDLKNRNFKAIETFARKGYVENPSGPMELYIKNGFKIHKDDPEFPLMRLEL
ncbi:MAG: GNAT family N-acetyltransferase [Nitrososphaeria archaeon]|nr:GNAT family N-acetyltransferase [Nitrososphaeria archaeon]